MNKKSIIGLVLIGLIMFGFSWYQSKLQLEQSGEQLQESAEVEVVDESIEVVEKTVTEPEVLYKDSGLNLAKEGKDSIYTISNDKLVLQFATKGAQLYSVKINDYVTYDSTALYLIKDGNSDMNLEIYTDENINTRDFYFQVAECTDSSIVMQLPFSNGGYIQQKYALTQGSYMVQNELSFVGMESHIKPVVRNFDIDWTVTIPRLEKGYKNEKQYSKLDYYSTGDDDPEDMANGEDESEDVSNRIKWFSFHQQFFSAIMTAEKEFISADFDVKFFEEDDPSRNLMTCTAKTKVDITPGEHEIVIPFTYYFGPNDYSTLKSYDLKYEETIPLGSWVVNWFSKWVIIPCFDLLGRFISNYGIVILIMTILIKLLLTPLTIKSYKSTAKMQVLKPEIDKLNQKYPDQKDAMKKQQATMELYRKAGISPMGGCLPMLLQMPILFAMFRFFPASIQLRQKPFLWADDLSAYDSIWDFGVNIPLLGDHLSLFALLMAGTMLLYSRMTSSQMSNDPNMAVMKFMSLWFMPIMMFVICNNLSAALSYYYLLSNIITMTMTWFIRKFVVTEDKVRAEMAKRAKQPVKKSKWMQRLEEAQKMQQMMQNNKR